MFETAVQHRHSDPLRGWDQTQDPKIGDQLTSNWANLTQPPLLYIHLLVNGLSVCTNIVCIHSTMPAQCLHTNVYMISCIDCILIHFMYSELLYNHDVQKLSVVGLGCTAQKPA